MQYSIELGSLKKDIGVCTLPNFLKDGTAQTDTWIKNVSNKLVQTFLQPRSESAVQTELLKPSISKISQMVQVNSLLQSRPKENANTQTEPPIIAEFLPNQRPVLKPPTKQVSRMIQVDTVLQNVIKENTGTQTESTPVKLPERLQVTESPRKSIAVGDGAVNDVVCDRCLKKRTRNVSCGTDNARQLAGVNVATQCYVTCEVIQLALFNIDYLH